MIIARSKKYVLRVAPLAFAVIVVFTARADAGFVPIPQPDATYLGQTTLLPISVARLRHRHFALIGGPHVSFDTPLVALTTPAQHGPVGARHRTSKAQRREFSGRTASRR